MHLTLATAHAVAAAVLLATFWVTVRRRDWTLDLRYYAVSAVAVACWGLAAGATLVAPPDLIEPATYAHDIVRTAATGAFGAFFVRFSEYDRASGLPAWLFGVVPTVLVGAVVLTNPVHGLVYTGFETEPPVFHGVPFPTFGPGMAVVKAIRHLFYYAVTGLMIHRLLNSAYVDTGGSVLAITTILVPPTADLVGFLAVAPAVGFDPTGLVAQVTGIALVLAFARYDLLDSTPVPRSVVLDGTEDALFVVRRNRVVDYNDAARPFLSVSDPLGEFAAEVLDARLLAFLPGADRPLPDEVRIETANGERRFDPAVTTAEGGRTVVISLRDVTELKETRRALERENERLDRFTGTVAHDLRNPLAVAQGYLPMVQDDEDAYDRAEAAFDRMDRMIDDLLALAREGEAVEEVENVPVASAATAAWESAASMAAGASLSVETEASVAADRDRLVQLFENLFRNAVEHGGEEVSVRVGELSEADGDGFYVADDGPGFPDENVFEEGYTTADDGTGFGLSIVSEIAEAHGWTVAATESSAGGARVEVTGCRLSSADRASPATHTPDSPPGESSPRSVR